MKDLIYMITPTSQSVLTNGIIPLTTIARRKGCGVNQNGNSVSLSKCGYYHITAVVVLTGSVSGDAIINLQKNGVDIAGMTATETIITASTESHTLTINGIIRVFPADLNATVSLVNAGIGITTTNVSLEVDYYC